MVDVENDDFAKRFIASLERSAEMADLNAKEESKIPDLAHIYHVYMYAKETKNLLVNSGLISLYKSLHRGLAYDDETLNWMMTATYSLMRDALPNTNLRDTFILLEKVDGGQGKTVTITMPVASSKETANVLTALGFKVQSVPYFAEPSMQVMWLMVSDFPLAKKDLFASLKVFCAIAQKNTRLVTNRSAYGVV